MNPSRIGVLSTLHAANLQLSASFFVEVARTQALSASDAPSPITSSLFSVGMLRSSITSSFFEVLAVPERSGGLPWIFGPVFPQTCRQKLVFPFRVFTFARFWAGPKKIGAPGPPQNAPKIMKNRVPETFFSGLPFRPRFGTD